MPVINHKEIVQDYIKKPECEFKLSDCHIVFAHVLKDKEAMKEFFEKPHNYAMKLMSSGISEDKLFKFAKKYPLFVDLLIQHTDISEDKEFSHKLTTIGRFQRSIVNRDELQWIGSKLKPQQASTESDDEGKEEEQNSSFCP